MATIWLHRKRYWTWREGCVLACIWGAVLAFCAAFWYAFVLFWLGVL